MTPAIHRGGLTSTQVTTNRQAISPATWTANLPRNNTLYPVTRLATADNSLYYAGRIPNASNPALPGDRVLLATLDFGSSIFIQDVKVIKVSAFDWYGSGAQVGVQISVDDDTGTLGTADCYGGSDTPLWTANRNSRYIKVYGARVGGYGTNANGNYSTEARIDCLSVTGAIA